MNNAQTAKNGFKTFIVTLVISLAVFGLFYYVLSARTITPDIEKETSNSTVVDSKDTLALATNPDSSGDTSTSPFKDLSQDKMDIEKKVVLSESTQSTSSVPDTGGTSITVGLIVSSLVLLLGFYVINVGPRKYALNRFEKKVLDDLDI